MLVGVTTCCCGPCRTWSDDFERANSTDLGTDWAEDSGDWSINSGDAVVSSAGAIFRNLPFSPALGAIVVDAEPTGIEAGAAHRVFCGWKDASNYFYAEACWYMVTTTWWVRLQLVKVTAGTPDVLATDEWSIGVSISNDYPMKVCFSTEEFAVAITAHPWFLWLQGDAFTTFGETAKGWGLGSGSSTEARFSKVEVSEHRVAKEDCPRCICKCGATLMPNATLTCTIESSDDCECLDHVVSMTQPSDMNSWYGDYYRDCDTPRYADWWIVLSCDPTDPTLSGYHLTLIDKSTAASIDLYPAAGSTCDPLYLRFETDAVAWEMICKGYQPLPWPITFEITE